MMRHCNIWMMFALFSLLAISAVGDVSAQPIGIGSSRAAEAPGSNSLSSSGGRFVFGQISDSNKDQYMLDTHSGRLWRIAESGKIGIYLKPVLYETREGEFSPAPRDANDQKTKKGVER